MKTNAGTNTKAERTRRASFFRTRSGTILAVMCMAATTVASAQDADVERGRYLYTDGYKCYACHGYDGQAGQPRLVPLNFTLEGFTALVQNSPLPQMPSFADVPADDLAAIFAYIGSIPVDAPEIGDIDLLSEIASGQREALEN